MPPLDVVLGSWTVNWAALTMLAVAALLYARGLRAARRLGVRWPAWRAAVFYGPGLGSFALLASGFTQVYSHDLRWAFTLKVTCYLFLVPLLAAAGRPVSLARATLGPVGRARLEAFLGSWPLRLLNNTVVAALLGLGLFVLFLTPVFYPLRTSPGWDAVLTVAVPLVGLLMAAPIIEDGSASEATPLIVVEFIFVFIELVADAVPGIMMRVSPDVLDGAVQALTGHPGWMPTPLRDQQLAGDLLWFLAEVLDIPLVILMFSRLARSDRREARAFDEISDEELEAMTREHLTSPHRRMGPG